MINIGHSHMKVRQDETVLYAEITISGETRTLEFAVSTDQRSALCIGRADPFIAAILPCAMRGGHKIICEDPVSEKLHYQLLNILTSSLARAGQKYREISITAPLTREPYENAGAVGTGFSGGVDSLYSVYRHDVESEYPIDYLAVFNTGEWDGKDGPGGQEMFSRTCAAAKKFAAEQNLKCICVNTNYGEILNERYLDVYSFRNLSCVLALQGLFSEYFLSSGHDIAHFKIYLHNVAYYDFLTVNSVNTESLSIWLSGMESSRVEKLKELSEWEPSYNWLRPCMYHYRYDKNCGHCKKCLMVETALYAFGKLENYKNVFDVDDYLHHLPQNIGLILSKKGDETCEDTIRLFEENHVTIPNQAYQYARLFAMRTNEALKSQQGE